MSAHREIPICLQADSRIDVRTKDVGDLCNYPYRYHTMKKVLFILPNLEHGGTSKSLDNLLKLLDKEKYCCKVVCSNPRSQGYYEEIFKDYLIQWPVWFQRFLQSLFIHRIGVVFFRLFNISFWYPVYKYAVNTLARKHQIDLVVGYQENRPTHIASAFSGNSVVWIHGVYSSYVESRKCTESCCFHRTDKIICVSKHAADVLRAIVPEDAHKIDFIYNLLDVKSIMEQSKHSVDDIRFKNDQFTIVSIGRYNWVKQFEKIPEIAKKVIDAGAKNFRWYIIGNGSQSLIQQTSQKIKDEHLEDNVILLGSKDNPYPYIAKSNLLISTSLSESCPYVVNEAKVLHIPVLSTDYPSAIELINPNNGIITPIEDMHTALTKLITNEGGIYQTLVNSCAKQHYDNTPMLDLLEKLL